MVEVFLGLHIDFPSMKMALMIVINGKSPAINGKERFIYGNCSFINGKPRFIYSRSLTNSIEYIF